MHIEKKFLPLTNKATFCALSLACLFGLQSPQGNAQLPAPENTTPAADTTVYQEDLTSERCKLPIQNAPEQSTPRPEREESQESPSSAQAATAEVAPESSQPDTIAEPTTPVLQTGEMSPHPIHTGTPASPTQEKTPELAQPEPSSQQVDFPEGYVIYNGLIWTPTSRQHALNWSEANKYCNNSIIHGMKGWRLPTSEELKALHQSGQMKDKGWYLNRTWSSTPHHKSDHFTVGLKRGYIAWTNDNLRQLVTCVYEFKEHEEQ